MKFVILFGPPAVGKTTIGKQLEKITKLKLFHNHLTIELVSLFFDFGTPSFNRLVNLLRQEILKEIAKSNLDGVIFTYVWAFNIKSDQKFIEKIVKIFDDKKSEIYYVELEADLKERIKRNKSPERTKHKPNKITDVNLLKLETNYKLNSEKDFFKGKKYIKINNSQLKAKKTAELIKKFLDL